MKPLIIRMKGDTAEVLIYDEIGQSPFGGGIDAAEFRRQVKAIKAPTINLRINSLGGNVFDAAAMKNALDEHKARIEVDVDGAAASSASVLAMSGDVVRMAANAMMMIHDPYCAVQGDFFDADGMRKQSAKMLQQADLLDKVKGQIMDSYAAKIGAKATRDQIAAWMAAETWFTGPEAIAAGLADETTASLQVAACAFLDRRGFRNIPQALLSPPEPAKPTPGELAEHQRRKDVVARMCGVVK